MNCLKCGHGPLEKTTENHRYTESGLSTVTLVGVQVRRCPSCDDVLVSIRGVEGLHRVIATELATQAKRLTGEEIRFLRKHLGWSGADFAERMAVTRSTVSRWETDTERMSMMAERLLRLFVAQLAPVQNYSVDALDRIEKEATPEAHSMSLKLGGGGRAWEADHAAA